MRSDILQEQIHYYRERASEYVVADLFNWTPNQQFDFIFFGFWLSHVPMEQFTPFWQMVKGALKPKGRVFFVDSLFTQNWE